MSRSSFAELPLVERIIFVGCVLSRDGHTLFGGALPLGAVMTEEERRAACSIIMSAVKARLTSIRALADEDRTDEADAELVKLLQAHVKDSGAGHEDSPFVVTLGDVVSFVYSTEME